MSQEAVKSAYRVFKILECFGQQQCDLSVSEIVDRCDFPQSSTSALMRTMTELGYMNFDRSNRTYRPTLRLPLLVNWISTRLFPGDKILQLMQDLSEATGETILLGAENGNHCRYIHVIEGTGSLRLHAVAGQTRPYPRTAAGLALLSTWDKRRLTGFIQRINSEERDLSQQISLPELLVRLANIRRDGCVTSIGGIPNRGGAVALLLPRAEGEQPLTIGIAGYEASVEANATTWIELIRGAIVRYFGKSEPSVDVKTYT